MIIDEAARAARMTAIRASVADRAAQLRQQFAAAAYAPAPGAQVAVREQAAVARQAPDGSQLLRDTRKFLRHFAVWPGEAALTVATLWIAQAHAVDDQGLPVWEYASRLLFTAAEYGAGKSWLSRLTASLAPAGKVLLEPTKPSLIDMIADRNTIVVTEVDELLATPGRNRGIVAVINASYEPGHYHTRKQGSKVQEIHLYAPMVLDGIDALLKATRPDMRGLVSRCLVIRVRMAPDGYRRPRWDKTAQALAARGRDRLAAWMAQEVADGLAEVVPELPEDLGSPRRCALWEPLFAVAQRADEADPEQRGEWTAAIRDAAVQTESALSVADEEDDTETELDRIMESWED